MARPATPSNCSSSSSVKNVTRCIEIHKGNSLQVNPIYYYTIIIFTSLIGLKSIGAKLAHNETQISQSEDQHFGHKEN